MNQLKSNPITIDCIIGDRCAVSLSVSAWCLSELNHLLLC